MSNGLPSYGRYLSRPTMADLEAEIATPPGFPFPFALVTFADDALPVLVFNNEVYPFLAPGDASRLVDANGMPVVLAAPDTVEEPTRYLVVQNAASPAPVQMTAFESGGGVVDLFVTSQGTGLAVLAANEGAVAVVADDATGLRAIRRSNTSGTPVKTLFVDHIPVSTLANGDGAAIELRVLPEGEPFGGTPITLASISAQVNNLGGTPTSSVDIAVIGSNVLTLNAEGAVVRGRATIDGLVYDSTPSSGDSAVGSDTALNSTASRSVTNSNVEDNSIISITPRALLQGAAQWWVTIPGGGGSFVVNFNTTLSANWDFDYEIKRVSS